MTPPVVFGLSPQTVLITTDPTKNQLGLIFTNQTGAPVTLAGGQPVPEPSIRPDGPTSFYLSFGTLLTPAELAQLKITADGWIAKYFPDQANWGLCPAADYPLANQGAVVFTVTNLLAAGQPRPGQATIDFYNVPTVSDDTQQIPVFAQNPPSGPTDLVLNTGFVNGDLVLTTLNPATPLKNTLLFAIANPSPTQPVVTQHWTSPPYFEVSFPCGDTPMFGALATTALAQRFSVQATSSSGNAWAVSPNVQGSPPYWVLTPSASNQGVLAGGEILTVTVGNVVSDFSIGETADVSAIYVQHANFPGYNDGYFSAAISLADGPRVTRLYLTPVNLFGGQTSAAAAITWAVENCSGVTFQGGNFPPNQYAASGTQGGGTLTNQPITLFAATNQSRGTGQVGQVYPQLAQTVTPSQVAVGTLTKQAGLFKLMWVAAVANGRAVVFPELGTGLQYATIDLADGTVTARSIAAAIPAGTQDPLVLGETPSPDGKTLYVLVTYKTSSATMASGVMIVAVDLATFTPKLAADLGPICGFPLPVDLAFSPDGSTAYFSFFDIGGEIFNSLGPYGVGQLWTLDAATFAVTNRSPAWDLPPETWAVPPSVLRSTADKTRVVLYGLGGFTFADAQTAAPVGTPYTVLFDPPVTLVATLFLALSPDGTRIYTITAQATAQVLLGLQLLVLEIDEAASGFTPLLNQSLPMPSWGTGSSNPVGLAFTLSPDGRTLYFSFYPDQIWILDTRTFSLTYIACGENGSFNSNVLAVAAGAPGVIYSSAGPDLTRVTVSPWPFDFAGGGGATARAGSVGGGTPRHARISTAQRNRLIEAARERFRGTAR